MTRVGRLVPAIVEMPLEEREDALAVVDALLADAREGCGRALVLEGPPGIGKTRLLTAFHERAQAAGMRTLRARAGELEQDFPFGIVRQLFEASLAGPARAELLSGAAELAGPLFDLGGSGELPAPDPAYSTLHGLYWLTVNYLEIEPARPVLLSVDDLHWCDPASLRYLAYLVRRLDGLGVLMVATMRPRATQAPGVIDEITDSPDATVLRLSPLSGDGVAALLCAHFGTAPDPEFSSSVSEWTAGNPLLLRELIAAAVVRRIEATSEGARQVRKLVPEGVGRLVLRRIVPLGPRSRAMAEAIAVLGEDAGIDQAAELAGLARDDASRATEALRGIDVLARGERLAFAHPVVRRAIYDDMAGARREALHAAAAELLVAAGAAPTRVATHLLAGGPSGNPATVKALRTAAREAMAQGAPDAAATYLARALAEPPADAERTGVILELGLALARARPAESVPHLLAVIEATDDDGELTDAALALTYAMPEDFDQWTAITLRAIDQIADERARRRLEANYIHIAGFRPDHYPAARALLDDIAAPEDPDDPTDRQLLGLKASHAARAGARPQAALELARIALAGDGLLRHDSTVFGIPCNVLIQLDHLDEALAALDTALAHARRTGFLAKFTIASWMRAWAVLAQGDLAAAASEVPSVVADPARIGGMRVGSAVLGQVALDRGDLAAAADHLECPDEALEPGVWGSSFNLARRGTLRGALGRLDDALDDLRTAGAWLTALGCENPAYCPWRSEAALVLARLDRRDEALELVNQEVALARRWGAPRSLGNALVAAGLVTGGGDGLRLLHEAHEVLADSPARLVRASAATEYGAALRRANRRADAREPLALGLELAERCGATALIERARQELIATGARPRRSARTGVDALTATELRVARMAAEGMTNRDVAQALFVTPKTVEVHLSHTYQKLGLKSRSQLPTALQQAA
jgi:DNA-binding CsgD family transcriptional regulator/tetratricopeptide (TPR) repeat protein